MDNQKHFSYVWEPSRARKVGRFVSNCLLTAGCVLIAWALIVLAFSAGNQLGY